MAIDALVKPLLSLPLFRGLPPLQLTEIVRRAERVIYAPGDVIAAENQLSDAAIVIVSGNCIRLDDDGGQLHGEQLPEGSMISELAMLVEVTHISTIIAQGPVKALRMTRERMRELMEDEPESVGIVDADGPRTVRRWLRRIDADSGRFKMRVRGVNVRQSKYNSASSCPTSRVASGFGGWS